MAVAPSPHPLPRAPRCQAALGSGGGRRRGRERGRRTYKEGGEPGAAPPGSGQSASAGSETRPIRAVEGTPGGGRELAGGQRDSAVPPLLAATGRGARAAGALPCRRSGAAPPAPRARPPGAFEERARPSFRLLIGCV